MTHRTLSHTADTGVEATAESLGELIAELAAGMFELIAHVDSATADHWVELDVEATTPADLVVDALSELLYLSEVDDVVFGVFRVDARPDPPRAHVAAGGAAVGSVEATGPPVKAATYHDLVVEERGTGWYGRVYLDV